MSSVSHCCLLLQYECILQETNSCSCVFTHLATQDDSDSDSDVKPRMRCKSRTYIVKWNDSIQFHSMHSNWNGLSDSKRFWLLLYLFRDYYACFSWTSRQFRVLAKSTLLIFFLSTSKTISSLKWTQHVFVNCLNRFTQSCCSLIPAANRLQLPWPKCFRN